MRCIFCLDDDPDLVFTKEHVFPEAIGGRFSVQSVCKACNDQLGSKVDCLLTEHVLIQVKRQALRLAGKTGRIPNLFERATVGGNPGHRIVSTLDAEGSLHLQTVRRVERSQKEGGVESVSITADVSERDILSRAGQPTQPPAEILSRARLVCTPHPRLERQFTVNDHDYKRCLLKIAFELACRWLGDRYLDDPQADLLRHCILSQELPTDEMARMFFDRIDLHEDGGISRFWDHEEDSHLGMLLPLPKDPGGIAAYVRIFTAFEGTVLVSKCNAAERYPSFESMFVSNPASGGDVRELRLSKEISRNRRTPSP